VATDIPWRRTWERHLGRPEGRAGEDQPPWAGQSDHNPVRNLPPGSSRRPRGRWSRPHHCPRLHPVPTRLGPSNGAPQPAHWVENDPWRFRSGWAYPGHDGQLWRAGWQRVPVSTDPVESVDEPASPGAPNHSRARVMADRLADDHEGLDNPAGCPTTDEQPATRSRRCPVQAIDPVAPASPRRSASACSAPPSPPWTSSPSTSATASATTGRSPRAGPGDAPRAGGADRHGRALRPRVARAAGRHRHPGVR
jgi:hypothetical protein